MFHQFTLEDADGKQHSYRVAAHNPTEGFGVCSRIAAAVIDPLAGTALSVLVKTVPAALKRAAKTDGSFDLESIMDDPEVMANLAGLDFTSSGPAMRRAIEAIDLPLVRDVLRHAERDGKPLARDVAFDTAYQRNYGELVAAVWKVGQYNRFFGPLGGFGALVRAATTKAKAALSPDRRPPTE
jgi:hypothetical protein